MNRPVYRLLLLIVAPLLIVALSGLRAYGVDQLQTTFQIRAFIGPEIFELRVTEDPHNSFMTRELQIKCVIACKRRTEYREDVTASPLGGFHLDFGSQFLTIWEGGAYYWVRVYDLKPGHITKIFDEASKEFPQIAFSPKGQPLIVLNYQNADREPRDVKLRGLVWQWDGHQYKALP